MQNDSNANARNPVRILLVDGDADSTELLTLILLRSRYEVRAVNNADAAVLELQRFRPGIMIVEIGLGRPDGYDLAQRIRDLRDNAPCTLIALSGSRPSSEPFLASLFDAFFLKPVHTPALLDAIERFSALPFEQTV